MVSTFDYSHCKFLKNILYDSQGHKFIPGVATLKTGERRFILSVLETKYIAYQIYGITTQRNFRSNSIRIFIFNATNKYLLLKRRYDKKNLLEWRRLIN